MAPTRAAFARLGPRATRSPVSSLLCDPPTPCPLRPRLRFPLPVTSLDAGACSVPRGPTARAPATCRASETGLRLSAKPGCVEERRGPPRFLDRPLRACYGRTPRRIYAPPRPVTQGPLLPSLYSSTLGIREEYRFRGRSPMARTFACLHIASRVFHGRRQACYRLRRAHP